MQTQWLWGWFHLESMIGLLSLQDYYGQWVTWYLRPEFARSLDPHWEALPVVGPLRWRDLQQRRHDLKTWHGKCDLTGAKKGGIEKNRRRQNQWKLKHCWLFLQSHLLEAKLKIWKPKDRFTCTNRRCWGQQSNVWRLQIRIGKLRGEEIVQHNTQQLFVRIKINPIFCHCM